MDYNNVWTSEYKHPPTPIEELQSLKGIGEKSAQKIIKRRKEKVADLPLEYLKMMSDIPNTFWDPLI